MQRHTEHKGEGGTGCRLQQAGSSQLFVHGRRGPFQNLACLENCSVKSFLTKSYNRVVCIEIYPFENIACVDSSLPMITSIYLISNFID